jgi:L-cysteine/cystine lyase
VVAPFMPDAEKIAAVREALPAISAGIYLAGAAVGPLPAETAAAMEEYAARELRIGRGHPDDIEAGYERIAEARAGVAAILAADVDAVTLTHGAAEGLTHATSSIDWRAGDRIVTTGFDGEAASEAIRWPEGRPGVAIDTVEEAADPRADADTVIAAFEHALRPETRLAVVSHVLPTTGAVIPLGRLASIAHERGVLLAVDGSLAVGAIPVVVEETGADFYAIDGAKWLLGPEGMGAVLTRPARDVRSLPVPSPSSFHKPSVVGFARSCGWLSMYVGLPWIHARAQALALVAADRLAAIDGVDVLTPRDRMATVISFTIRGWRSDAALAELGSRVYAIAGIAPGVDAIRIGIGFYNEEAEIDRFASAVELLARHSPETLPPRALLTILGQDDR